MSYILEALKRAERERRAGTSALLDELPPTGRGEPVPAWKRWLIPALVSAAAAALLTFLLVGRGRHDAVSTVAQPSAGAPIAATSAPQPAPAQAALAPTPSAATTASSSTSSEAVEDDGTITTLNDIDEQPQENGKDGTENYELDPNAEMNDANGDPLPAAAQAEIMRAREQREHPTPARNRMQQRDGAQDMANAAPVSALDSGSATNGAAASSVDDNASDASPTTATSPAGGSTQNLREMPDSFRASFPPITVDVHAYSEVPAQRFVLIDGKRYHENDRLPQGPRIAGIVPEGIVFDWQGQRVLYAMNH